MTPALAVDTKGSRGVTPIHSRARVSVALAFPWLLGALLVGLIALDRGRPTGAAAARDPVCQMTARSAAADTAAYEGREFHFCSGACRAEFEREPARYAAEAERPAAGHTMQGLPTRLYQWALAAVLVASFGLIEVLLGAGKTGPAPPARLELTRLPGVRRLLAWKLFPFLPRAVTAALFVVVVLAGLFGDQSPAANIAPLLTWTVWWTGLIFAVLYLGKAWCTVCPWDALATWAARGPRGEGLGLGLAWPRPLRNIWLAVGLFLLLTWIELGAGITLIPRATAWVALAMLGLAVASAFLFDRKAFCRYGCLVGRISGLYALFSCVEVRPAAGECASCRTLDCWRGNGRGDGCPTFEFPRALSANTYCTMCAECFKTCPRGAMTLRLRPWGADLAGGGRPRADEAALAVVLLAMTAFHGLTMTPAWARLLEAARAATGLPYTAAFTALMAFCLAAPALAYAGLAWLSARWAGVEAKPVLLRFAYALLPIALFYHLAHNAEHFLFEGPRLIALASDPFGWGWNLFGTARWRMAPLVTLEGLWRIQALLVVVGHLYSLWITARAARRLADGSTARLKTSPNLAVLSLQLPMLAAMVAFSWASLWLLRQPMEMRASGM